VKSAFRMALLLAELSAFVATSPVDQDSGEPRRLRPNNRISNHFPKRMEGWPAPFSKTHKAERTSSPSHCVSPLGNPQARAWAGNTA
jgi:hypothetical protein